MVGAYGAEVFDSDQIRGRSTPKGEEVLNEAIR